MAHVEGRLHLSGYLEFDAIPAPPVSLANTSRMYWDAATGKFLMSVAGGAYAEVPSLVAGSLSAADMLALASASLINSQFATPKLTVYQETVLFSQFTDGGGAAGTYSLAHTIPAGAYFLKTLYTGITGFTGDLSAAGILGDGTDTDRYMTGTPSVFTTAAQGVDVGAPSGTAWHTAAKTPVLTVTSGSDWGFVVAGAVTVTLYYYAP
jgi:hypothetical protein